MLPKMLQLKSGGYGPDVTVADSLKAAAVRPVRVQAVLIGGPAVIVIAIALGNAWINNH